ncbi:hypothetical protein FRC06_002348 [Ceratobasidium sp. 370]|nr:hypothetical protein FRC06_002348 [Ceratobasidium sp. 370]
MSCRRGEETIEEMKLVSNAEFQSIFDMLVSALEEMKGQLGAQSDAETETTGTKMEMEGPETEVEMEGLQVEAEEPGAKARTSQTEMGQQTAMSSQMVTGEPTPTNHAGSDVEPTMSPQHEHAPDAARKTHSAPQSLLFDKKENTFVEHFPDPCAGAPINNTTIPMPDLDEYMTAAGNPGNPLHFDTAELLLTTGLTVSRPSET